MATATAHTRLPPAAPLAHHVRGGFVNPWTSFQDRGPLEFFTKALPVWDRSTVFTPQPVHRIPWRDLPRGPLSAMWIGHVTFLLHIRGWRVLTDPLFSRRASPVQWAGPARYTPPACTVDALPPIDAILISHSHYDHLDAGSVRALLAKADADARADVKYSGLTWVCALGVDKLLSSLGVPSDRIRCLDWWDETTIIPDAAALRDASRPTREPLRVTVVPAQHQSARTAFDRNTTLWCGFVVTGAGSVPEGSMAACSASTSVYFSGDTGYRSVAPGVGPHSDGETNAVRCPVFAEIAVRCPPLDLALLPIGAYSPRAFMSAFHCSPEDAVEMFLDTRARAAVGMHWGSVPLTDEPVRAPVERLAEAARRRGLPAGSFIALEHGGVWTPDGVLAEADGGGCARGVGREM